MFVPAIGPAVHAGSWAESIVVRRGCALGITEVLPRDEDVVAAVRERHPDVVDAIVDLVNFTPRWIF